MKVHKDMHGDRRKIILLYKRSLKDHWKTIERSLKDLHKFSKTTVFQSSCRGLGQSIRVLSVVLVCLSENLIGLSKIFSNTPDNLSVISQWSYWSLSKLSAVFRVPRESCWNCCFWSFIGLSGVFGAIPQRQQILLILKTAERPCEFSVFQWSFNGLRSVEWGP